MSQRKGLASLLFVLGANISEFQTEFRKAEREMQRFGKNMQRVGKDFSRYVTLPIVAFGTGAVMSFRQVNEAMKQVEAGIESTGGMAGFTAKELKKMSYELMIATNTLNSDILSDVTAQLLTFTNLQGDVFEKAQMAVLDLSTRMKTDLKSASVMVGKALNDPILGLTAMRRVGIQFNEEQENVIKALVETGDVASAQGKILEELERQFGGSADAGGDAINAMTNSIKVLGQEFGAVIFSAITPMAEGIQRIVQRITEWDQKTKNVVLTVAALAAAIGPVMIGIGFMAKTVIPMAINGFIAMRAAVIKLTAAMVANPITAIAVAVGAVAAGLLLFRKRTDEATEAQWKLGDAVKEVNTQLGAQIWQSLGSYFERAADGTLQFNNRIDDLRTSVKQMTREELLSLKSFLENDYAEASREAANATDEGADALANITQTHMGAYLEALEVVNGELEKFKTTTVNVNEAVTESIGLIGSLSAELKKLQDGLSSAKTEEEIGKLNDQIHDLQEEINRLRGLSANAMGQLGENAGVSYEKMAMLPGVIKDGIVPALKEMKTGVQEVETVMTENIDAVDTWAQALKSSFEYVAEGFVSLITDLASGNISFKGVMAGLFDMLGDISIQLGRTAIAVGITVESIKEAIKSLSGIGAILAGGVLLSLGRFIKSYSAGMAPKMAGGGEVPPGFYGDKYPALLSSGEIVVPPRKLEDFLGKFLGMNPAPVEVLVTVNGKLSGNDLLMSVERAARNRKMNIGR
jgi:hypothetical protein